MTEYKEGRLICDCGSISFSIVGDFGTEKQIQCTECDRIITDKDFKSALLTDYIREFYGL